MPMKMKVKSDTMGLGVRSGVRKALLEKRAEKLDAKKVRKKELEDRLKRETLQEIFYRNDNVQKYLGGG